MFLQLTKDSSDKDLGFLYTALTALSIDQQKHYFNNIKEVFPFHTNDIFDELIKFESEYESYIIRDNNINIGIIVLYYEFELKRAHLMEFFIYPEFRGRGFGTKSIEWMLEKLKEEGIESAMLAVIPFNESALRLYTKFGFVNICQDMYRKI